jgi:hypothetical protein
VALPGELHDSSALCRLDAEGFERIGMDAERSVVEPDPRKPLLVYRLHDTASWDTQQLRGFGPCPPLPEDVAP